MHHIDASGNPSQSSPLTLSITASARSFLLRPQSNIHQFRCLAEARSRTEAECIHGADCHTDATANTGAVCVRDGVFLQREAHDVDADLAITRAFIAAYALVVGDNLESAPSELGEQIRLHLHQLR